MIGPNDNVEIPKKSVKSDWEVELGVIIGKEAKYISESESQSHIAGYCVINDLSEREFQIEHSGQWVKGKSCDTFGPIGPYLVTTDEIISEEQLAHNTKACLVSVPLQSSTYLLYQHHLKHLESNHIARKHRYFFYKLFRHQQRHQYNGRLDLEVFFLLNF